MADQTRDTEVQYASSQPSNSDPSQSFQHATSMPAPAPPRHTAALNDILNDPEPKPNLVLDDRQVLELHENLVKSTSGCSLEQLEQINAALMDTIWRHRANYNRNQVLQHVKDSFNVIINDIQEMQKILKSSQEELEEQQQLQRGYYSSRYDDGTQAGFTQRGIPGPSQDEWFQQTQAPRH